MSDLTYHYIECGLNNVYLMNGFAYKKTPRGEAVSITDIDGLQKAIGLNLATNKKDLEAREVKFLRLEMLMSQNTLAQLLGVSDQAIRRWENGKIQIPKPSESLMRLLYLEYTHNQEGKVSSLLKKIAHLENRLQSQEVHFKATSKGWRVA